MTSNTLILNSSNIIGSNNNIFQYNFINSGFYIPEGSEISISSVQIPYSFYNVSSFYDNRKFTIRWPVGASFTDYNVVLDEGFYTINDIQNFIQNFCITNSLYFIDANGDYIYFIYLAYNITAYKIQLIVSPVPTVALTPATVIVPSGFPTRPTTNASTPLFIVNDNRFGSLLGFNIGTYPSAFQSSSFNRVSDYTPKGSNINSIVIRANVVENSVTMPSDILDSFGIPLGSQFGSNINYEPSFQKWVSIRSGNYTSMIITIQDQDYGDMKILDPNSIITLIIKYPKKIK
jgi:hypothetical protein